MKNGALSHYVVLGISVLVSGCNSADRFDMAELDATDKPTLEAQANLKPSWKVISLFSDTADLTFRSYAREPGKQYVLDIEDACLAGMHCDFVVERSSVADVVGVESGDRRGTLTIQNNGFDGCVVTYGDFGQGLATRASCHIEVVREDASVSFIW